MTSKRLGLAPRKAVTYEEHVAWARKLWSRIDRDDSDEITRDELTCDEFQEVLRSIIAPDTVGKGMATYGRSEINLSRALNYCLAKADKNNDGVLNFGEFEAFLRFLRNERSPEHIANVAFALFDVDNSNKLCREELREIWKFFLGHHALDADIKKAWVVLDPSGLDYGTRETFIKWLKHHAPPCFKQHVAPVKGPIPPEATPIGGGSPGGSPVGSAAASSPGGGARRSPAKVFRPAPGLLPRPPKSESMLDDVQPDWNGRFSAGDPSSQNLAWRGNQRMKTFFSRPQSLPELHRFYCTYEGFEKNRKRLYKPEPFVAKHKLVLSTDSVQMKLLPGASRHKPGGIMRNPSTGEIEPWRENTPRALIRPVWAPGSLLLRHPGPPAPSLVLGRDVHEAD